MRWLQSFGFRVGLMVVLLAGSILALSSIAFLFFIRQSLLQQVDHKIITTAEGQLRRQHPSDYWSRFQGSLSFVHGRKASDWAFQVTDPEGTLVYQSAHWPFVDFQTPALKEMPPEDIPQKSEFGFDPLEDRPPERRAPPRPEDNFEDFFFPTADRPLRGRPGAGPPENRRPPRMKKPVFETRSFAGHHWRIGSFGHEANFLNIALRLDDVDRDLRQLAGRMGLFLLGGLILLNFSGSWIAQRTLKPVLRLTETARGITATGLDNRIDASGASLEFAELIGVINQMLSRLERSYSQAVRFSADAAHELRTPLTVLQGELDRAIQAAPAGGDSQQQLVGMIEEVQQLTTILRKLLLLSRADSGDLPLYKEKTDLSSLIHDLIEDAHAVDETIKITSQVPSGMVIEADPDLLRQVFTNLFSNAMKYKGEPGALIIELQPAPGGYTFEIENDGPPIDADFRGRIFDRFTRGDRAHSRSIPGQGLGLSLAREIILAHGGQLDLIPGKNRFRLFLPDGSTPI